MIVSKSSIEKLAELDAIEADSNEFFNGKAPERYALGWMQELYVQYFWTNLRELRGECRA